LNPSVWQEQWTPPGWFLGSPSNCMVTVPVFYRIADWAAPEIDDTNQLNLMFSNAVVEAQHPAPEKVQRNLAAALRATRIWYRATVGCW